MLSWNTYKKNFDSPEKFIIYQSLQRMSEFQMLSFFNLESLIIIIVVACGKARGQNPKMPKKKTLRVQRRTTRGLRLYWRLARKNA